MFAALEAARGTSERDETGVRCAQESMPFARQTRGTSLAWGVWRAFARRESGVIEFAVRSGAEVANCPAIAHLGETGPSRARRGTRTQGSACSAHPTPRMVSGKVRASALRGDSQREVVPRRRGRGGGLVCLHFERARVRGSATQCHRLGALASSSLPRAAPDTSKQSTNRQTSRGRRTRSRRARERSVW